MARAMPDSIPLEISVQEVAVLLQRGEDLFLLDCREPAEFALARLDGAALIPMQEIPPRLDELAPLRDRRIIIHCHHGVRSLMVAEFLRRQGFTHARSMSGGIDAWSRQIDASVPRY